MATNSIDHASLQKAKAILLEHPAVEPAYLLGSAAENRLREDTDVDIAILLRTATAMSAKQRREAVSAWMMPVSGSAAASSRRNWRRPRD